MAFTPYLRDLLNRHFFLGETLPSPIAYPSVPSLGLIDSHSSWSESWTELPALYDYGRVDMSSFGFGWDATNYILYPAADIYFPRANGGNWGTVEGLGLYDYSTVGVGNLLLTMPWFATPTGPKVSTYTINENQRIYFRTSPYYEIKFSIHGKEPVDAANGGISTQYATVISQWIGNLSAVPYARTYDIALGRDLQIDSHGRFTGYWTEVSGTNYHRVSVPTTGWSAYTGGTRNTSEIVFTELAVGNWGYIEYVVLYPTGSPNTPAFWGHLDTPVTINAGMGFAIGATRLQISWEGEVIT